LEPGKESGWPQPDGTPAIRTPAAFQQKGFIETIEKSGNISMPPDHARAAPGTPFQLGPWKITALFGKFLENHREKEYHELNLVGDHLTDPG
jgi:hypothetical protein